MHEAVINEYGHSYEKDNYVSFVNYAKKDPKSDKPIKSGLIYPNIILQKAIDQYLEE